MSNHTQAAFLLRIAGVHFAGYIVLAVMCILINLQPYKDKLPQRIREYLWSAAVVFLLAAIYHAL